ncbi:MAG: hypothetical protein CW342_07855 [Thermoactinomycetaceae bacterium]|nr:hypothetical protein [Bacillota bacterium]MBO2532787.1 hypothetical protein [Thermoactinomycetaceae bacterium]
MKWKGMLLIALAVILLGFFLYMIFSDPSLALKPSEVDPDFPIPARSEKVEKPHASKGWTFYEIWPPLSGKQFGQYLQEIEKRGWKQVDQMGRLHVFEKDGKRMLAVLYGEEISLLLSKKR